MFILILIVMSTGGLLTGALTGTNSGTTAGAATGSIAVKTIPFSSERHCEMAAKKLNEKTDKNIKVLAVCVDPGLAH